MSDPDFKARFELGQLSDGEIQLLDDDDLEEYIENGRIDGRGLHSFTFQLNLSRKNTLHTLNTPQHPLHMGYTIPTRTHYPIKSA